MTKNKVDKIDDQVKVNNILLSVSDKSGLESFVTALVKINPEITIYSTGGTYARINDMPGMAGSKNLVQVSDYTGQPETQGGLVKTLDFRIYLGILTETYNDAHQQDLERTQAVPIDMVVVNLYPFRETINRPEVTPEDARGNIDIGGPTMIRSAAKNYLRVASVTSPDDYPGVIDTLNKNNGCTTLEMRYHLAVRAFEHTAVYDRAIADYLKARSVGEIAACYSL